jgi:translation initiation factor IF-2
MLHLVSSLNPPQTDPEGILELSVLESRLDSRKGPLAVVVVKNGTATIGQTLFQSLPIGKIKALIDSDGKNIPSAPPSMPVEILGLTIVPQVGSTISEKAISVPDIKQSNHETIKSDSQINLILKTDVAGSLEAIRSVLPQEFHIVFSGTGELTENDILQARPVKAIVISFNLKIPSHLEKLAQVEKVTLKNFRIIYELLDYLEEILSPKDTAVITGKAEILADFKINSERIAGCRCLEGNISKSMQIHILRSSQEIGITRIKSLKVGKKDVPLVKSSIEFGAVFSPYIDFKVGDSIIATTG